MIVDCKKTAGVLESRREIKFAYLHGSVLTASAPQDIDLAVHLDGRVHEDLRQRGHLSLGFVIPLEMELEGILGLPVDVQVLNDAPLSFRHRVFSTGKLLVDRDQEFRENITNITAVEYFDFRPRREEYLAEVMA